MIFVQSSFCLLELKTMSWTKFEIYRLNYHVCTYLILISIIQNAIYYYLLYEFSLYGSQFFFNFVLYSLLILKFVWLIGLEYEIIKYTPVGPHHYWSILLFDFLPLILFRYRTSWSMTFRHYFWCSISHSLLVSIPMGIMITVHLINYPQSTMHLDIITAISVILTSFTVPLIFVGHGSLIPCKANLFHLICLYLDCFHGFLTVWFITNWIFHNLYNTQGPSQIFWQQDIVYIASIVYCSKTFIASPLYAIFLLIFHGTKSAPHCYFCRDLWGALGIGLIPIFLLFVWLFVDTIFYSYPLLIFYHSAYEYQFDVWFKLISFLHQRFNKMDYRLRVYLFNYLWLIQRVYAEKQDLNQAYTPTAYKQSNTIKFDVSTRRKICDEDLKYFHILQQVEKSLIWYLTPTNENEKRADAKEMEVEWNQVFDLNIFLSKGDKISAVIYEGYDVLMSDILMKFFDLRKLAGSKYNKVVQQAKDSKPSWCYEGFRNFIEFLFAYLVAPIQILLAVYGVIVYPIIVFVALCIEYDNAPYSDTILFWFILSYFVIIIVMLALFRSFYEMVACLWYSLYSRAGTWQEEPQKYLEQCYNYIHLNRQRVDVIQQKFEGVIAIAIFEYLGLSAVESDDEKHYVLPHAVDLLDILNSAQNRTDYDELIQPSLKMLNDCENRMIHNIQQKRHAFNG